MAKAPEHTIANGFTHGRPAGREPEELDMVIERVIEKIPAATRLFPEIYAWKVTEAVKKFMASQDQ
jgi:hypothetical protein